MKKRAFRVPVFLLFFTLFFTLLDTLFVTSLPAQEEKPVTIKDIKDIKEQYRQTMKGLEILRNGIIDYQQDFKNAPQAKSITEMLAQDIGNGLPFTDFYLEQIPVEQIPLKDAWGNEYLYKHQNEKYWIASAGSDGKFEGFGQNGVYLDTEKEIAGKDIIISNTGFVYFPIPEDVYQFSQRGLNLILTQ